MFKSCISLRPVASIFGVCMCVEGGGGGGRGGAYLKNWDQIAILMLGKFQRHMGFRGVQGMLPCNNFEVSGPQTAGNAFKLSILPSPHYFVSF